MRARWRGDGLETWQRVDAPPQGRGRETSVGAILALAYPDRIAKNRGNGAFTLANGRGGNVDQASPLAREPFIAVAELTGSAANARIVLAAPIALEEIEARFADRIESRDEVTFDEKSLSLRARRSRRLGAIALTEQTRKVEPSDETARAARRGHRARRRREAAVDQGADPMARPRDVPA